MSLDGIFLHIAIIDDNMQLGFVFFRFGDFGKIQGLELGKHTNDARSVIGVIFNGVPM